MKRITSGPFAPCILLALVLAIGWSSSALAVTLTWNSTSSTDFNLATNYTPTTGPVAGADLIFPTKGTLVNPTLTANISVNSITFSGTAGGYTIACSTFTLTLAGATGINATAQTSGTNTFTGSAATSINLTLAQTWTVGTGGTVTVNGVIGGTVTLTVGTTIALGTTGNLNLTAANTLTGVVTINAGSLTASNNASLGSGTKNINISAGTAGNPQLHLQNNITLPATFTYNTSNSSSATTGAFVNDSGTNTIAGTITVTSGGGDTPMVVTAGTLNITAKIQELAANGTRSVRLRGAGNGTISGNITPFDASNSPAVVQEGTGTWTISGAANTFVANSSITSGTIVAVNNTSLGAVPGGAWAISGGGTLDIGGNSTANNVNYGAKLIQIAGAGVGSNGAIINTSGTPASQINAFQNMQLTAAATIGGAQRWDLRGGTAVMNMGGFALTKVGANQISLASATVSNVGNITVSAGTLNLETSTFGVSATNLNPSWTGPVTLTGVNTFDIVSGGTLTASGAFTGAGGVTKITAGTLNLTGTGNAYTGATTVTGGKLLLAGTALPSQVAVGAGATLNPTGAGVNTPGTLTLTSATAPLTAAASANLNFRLNGAPGAGGVNNDYIDASAGPVSLQSGTIINLSSLGSNGTYTLIKASAGNLQVGGSASAVPTLGPLPPQIQSAVFNNDGTSLTVVLTFSSTSFAWNGNSGDTKWTTGGNWAGGVAPVGNNTETLIFGPSASNFVANDDFGVAKQFVQISITTGGYTISGDAGSIATLAPAPNALNVNTTSGNTIISLVIDGTGGVGATYSATAGTVTVSGLNTYDGPTTLNAGSLSVNNVDNGGNASALGNSGSAATNLVFGSAVTFQYLGTTPGTTDRLFTMSGSLGMDCSSVLAANTITFTNTGSIIQSGTTARTLTLSGTNTGVSTLSVSIPNAGAGAVAVAKSGAGTWALGGTNSYTTGTTISAGFLQVSSDANLGTPPGAAATNITMAGGTLRYTGSFTLATTRSILLTVASFYDVSNGVTVNYAGTMNGGFAFTKGLATASGGGGGTGTFNYTGVSTSATLITNYHQHAGTLILDTPAQITSGAFVSVGQDTGDNATMTVQGSSIFTVTNSDLNMGDVGSSIGTLNVAGTATVNCGAFFLGKNTTCQGILNLSGGTVTKGTQTSGNDWRIAGNNNVTGNPTVGIVNQTGGTFTTPNNFQIGSSGTGLYSQSGGAVTITGGFTSIGRFTGSSGFLDLSGGTFSFNVPANIVLVGEVASGNLTVRGTSVFTATSTIAAGGLRVGNSATASGQVNLLTGGTIQVQGVTMIAGSSGTFNFNGGKLQASAANAAYLTGLSNAYVFPGGAQIDSQANAITIAQNLLNPPSSGVASVTITAGGTGFINAPIVVFSGGGGTGATAVAVVSGGAITSILVTNPGVNYSSVPTITLKTVNGGTGAILTPVLDVNTSGGFTKLGTGTLTLTGANTYSGANNFNGGLVNFANLGNLGTSTAWNFAGGGIQYATGNTLDVSATRTLTFNTGGATIDTNNNAVTLASSIANGGVGGFTKAGLGTLTLTADDTVGGGIIVTGGTLAVTANTTTNTNAANPVQIANASGQSSTVTVSGTGTLTAAGELWIGQATGATGVLNLQTGGTINVGSWFVVARAGATGTFNMSGGTLNVTPTTQHFTMAGLGGIGIINQTGGTINSTTNESWISEIGTGTYNISAGLGNFAAMRFAVGNAGNGTINLNGGIISATQILPSTGTGTSTFAFKGGTLKAAAASSTFMTGLTTATVNTGGGTIDTQAFNITIGQALTHGTGTPDGGLIKVGTGTLTFTGVNTYNGPTSVSAGNLTVATGGSLTASASSVSNSATMVVNGTAQAVQVGASSASSPAIAGSLLRGTGNVGAVTFNDTANLNSVLWPGAATTVTTLSSDESLTPLTASSVNFTNGGKFAVLVKNTGGPFSQKLVVTNNVTIPLQSAAANTYASLSFATDTTPLVTASFTVLTSTTGSINNSFNTIIPPPGFTLGTHFDIQYSISGGSPQLQSVIGPGVPLGVGYNQVDITFSGTSVTPVTLDSFSAKSEGAGVNVSWKAVSEYQNAGFNIYRRSSDGGEWTLVNPSLIAGRVTNPDEKMYSYFDWTSAGEWQYKLESVDLAGVKEMYGEFAGPVSLDWNADLSVETDVNDDSVATANDGFAVMAGVRNAQRVSATMAAMKLGTTVAMNSVSVRKVATDASSNVAARSSASTPVAPAVSSSNVGVRWFSSGNVSGSTFSATKLTYGKPGVMIIPQASMPGGYDLLHVSLQREGRNFNALAKVPNGLLVYAPGYQDDYTDKDALFIRKTTSETYFPNYPTSTGLFKSSLPVSVTSPATVTREYHDVYFDYSSGYRPFTFTPWFSSKYLIQGTTQDFVVNLPQASSGPAKLTLNLWSLTSDATLNPDHSLQLVVNGQIVGDASWDGGNKMMQLSFNVPTGVMTSGDNTVSIVTPTLAGVSSQVCFIHSISADYTRTLDGSKSFELVNNSGKSQLYELNNVPATGAWVVDTRFSDRASLVATETQVQADGSLRLRFTANAGGTGKFVVTPTGQENAPFSINARMVKAAKLTGTYLATGPLTFSSGTQPLLTKRSKEGIRGTYFDQEQLFDYYNFGRFGPDGIRNAVRSIKPTYLLLVGRTTYDYRNYEGKNIDPLCPAYLVSTSFWAQTTSDSLFGDLGRGYPEVAVGRLPINNTTELAGAIGHILGYKGIPQSALRLHAVADQPDPLTADFGAQLDAMVKAYNPDVTWQENYLARTYQTAAEVTDALKTAANGGADLILYSGHGNAARLGNGPTILDATMVQQWAGNTVFLQSTCTANWMAKNVDDYKSIAIQALTQPQGGISASVGTSTYMNPDVATAFVNQLIKNTNLGSARWGSVLLKTQKWAGRQTTSAFYIDLMNTEQLFGDPAMPVFAPKSVNTAPSSSSGASTPVSTF